MSKKVPFSSCVQEAYEQKRRKKFVGKRLGVTPKSWLTPNSWLLIWNFVIYTFSCVEHVEKSTKTTKFQMSNQLLGVLYYIILYGTQVSANNLSFYSTMADSI